MDTLNEIFGIHVNTLTTLQMISRAIVIFGLSLVFIRIAGIRTIGSQTTFDNITTIILGAILGRSIVSAQQPFFQSLIAVTVLMFLHRGVAWLSFKNHFFGKVFKGEHVPLVENGTYHEKNFSRNLISMDDLIESLHLFLNSEELEDIKSAYLERSGEISIIRKDKK